MRFTLRSKPSLMKRPKANPDFLQQLAEPLLDRQRIGQPALALVYYEGDQLDPSWPLALAEYFRQRGTFMEHLQISDLGKTPAHNLLRRHRSSDHLFSIAITPDDLPDAALTPGTAVAMLNIHRDSFRDAKLGLILWVPLGRARRFMDLASNLSDYRTVDMDLPPGPAPGAVGTSSVAVTPPVHGAVHNLPFRSLGSGFIGRTAEMQQLRHLLTSGGSSAITDTLALEGLGGVGKTRLATEYAWAHLADYTHIFLIRADSPASVRSGLAGLAAPDLLGLPGGIEVPEEARLQAVLDWFQQHQGWLLILDNADAQDSAAYLLEEILPRLKNGHVLVTTRYQRWGGEVQALKLAPLLEDDATAWLLNATTQHRLARADDARDARAIVQSLGGLPLAVEQVAAWVREHALPLSEVLLVLQEEDSRVLGWYDPRQIAYPRPVAAVWELTTAGFSADEAALVRLLAHLSPQPVPDFLLSPARLPGMEKEADLWPLVRGLEARSILTARDDRATQLHRLWIELERRRTPAQERPQWITAALAQMRQALPKEASDVRNWPRILLLEAHAQTLITATAALPVSAFQQPPWQLAAADLSFTLNQLALFWKSQARHAEAEPLYRRALEIDEASYGPDHPKVAIDLNNLAALLQATNRLAEAEPLFRRALKIDEASYGPDHSEVAIDLNNLAQLLQATNRLGEAEPLYRRALKIDEASYGPDHPKVAIDLNNLAQLLQDTNRLGEAEPLMRRALKIDEASYGPDHPKVAIRLNNLAQLLQATNRLGEAEPLMERVVGIFEKAYGKEHPNVATALNNLAELLRVTNRLGEAEPLYRRALKIDEASYGPDHPEVATDLNNLAQLLQATNRLAEAEPLMRRHLVIFLRFQVSTGHPHPYRVAAIRNYRGLLQEMGRTEGEVEEELREVFAEAGLEMPEKE